MSGHRTYRTRLHAGGWPRAIEESHGLPTPYMLTDVSILRNNCLTFKRLFPDVALFYAVKAFPDIEVIRAVEDIVDGYDAASIAEIQMLLGAGIDPDRIAYSNPVKSESSIARAASYGVTMFAYQSESELQKIARQAPMALVYLRVKMEDAHSAVPLSVKFGCEHDQAIPLLKTAVELALRPIGMTFHVGSQATDARPWEGAIAAAHRLVRAAASQGIDLRLVNVGGGFPVQYSEDDPSIELMADAINRSLITDGSLRYMAEPGRFIVAESSVIVSSIIGREERDGRQWLYLDIGVFQAFTGTMRFDSFPHMPYALTNTDGASERYVLSGPSCDSHDVITVEAVLPEHIGVGDRLVFPNVGAYTIVYGSNFNGFEVPDRHFVNTQVLPQPRACLEVCRESAA